MQAGLSICGVSMPRYVVKPIRTAKTRANWYGTEWSDGETQGREVYDDGSWSEDQPTGLLNAQGEMIYRARNSIGFLADL